MLLHSLGIIFTTCQIFIIKMFRETEKKLVAATIPCIKLERGIDIDSVRNRAIIIPTCLRAAGGKRSLSSPLWSGFIYSRALLLFFFVAGPLARENPFLHHTGSIALPVLSCVYVDSCLL